MKYISRRGKYATRGEALSRRKFLRAGMAGSAVVAVVPLERDSSTPRFNIRGGLSEQSHTRLTEIVARYGSELGVVKKV